MKPNQKIVDMVFSISFRTYDDKIKYWDGKDWTYNKQSLYQYQTRKQAEKVLKSLDTKAIVLAETVVSGFII